MTNPVDSPAPRTEAPDWMRPFMEPDGGGLHADTREDVIAFLKHYENALREAAAAPLEPPRPDPMVPIIADMLRMTGVCEKGHRKGVAHFHDDSVHRWAQRLNNARLDGAEGGTAQPLDVAQSVLRVIEHLIEWHGCRDSDMGVPCAWHAGELERARAEVGTAPSSSAASSQLKETRTVTQRDVNSPVAPRTEAGRLPAEHPDRCQTWGYFSGLRCWYRQGHRGTHRLEPLTEPLTHQFGVGKRAEGEAAAPLEPPRPDHPRTYSLVGSPRLFLVTDDESGINIGYADKIGGPLVQPPLRVAAPDSGTAQPLDVADMSDTDLAMTKAAIVKEQQHRWSTASEHPKDET